MTPEQKTLYFDVMGELYEDVTFLGKESSFPLYSNWAICYILSSWKMHTCESVPAVGWFSAWWCEGRGKADPDHLESFFQIHIFLLSRLLDLSYSCPTLQAHSCQIFSMSVESTVYPVVQAPKLSVILFSSPLVIPTPQPIREQVLLTLSSKELLNTTMSQPLLLLPSWSPPPHL